MKHPYAHPQQNGAYGKARDKLLAAELALRDQRERVAEMRRNLPPGPVMPDYLFREGPADLSRNDPADFFDTRLSELFAPVQDSLILVHFMYAPDWEQGCPMCSMWADGYDGAIPHLNQSVNLAVTARAGLEKLRAWAGTRGWRNLRLLSTLDNTFTADFGMEPGGSQMPGISVFKKEAVGSGDLAQVRHVYTCGAVMGEGEYRGMDLLSPVWHFLDLLPQGRGDWNPGNPE